MEQNANKISWIFKNKKFITSKILKTIDYDDWQRARSFCTLLCKIMWKFAISRFSNQENTNYEKLNLKKWWSGISNVDVSLISISGELNYLEPKIFLFPPCSFPNQRCSCCFFSAISFILASYSYIFRFIYISGQGFPVV